MEGSSKRKKRTEAGPKLDVERKMKIVSPSARKLVR
jgi:hypothetical protein